MAIRVRFIPSSLAAGSFWLGLLTTFLIDPDMSEFGDIGFIGTVFFALGIILWAFVPLLFQMRTDITTEKRARGKGEGETQVHFTTKSNWKWNKPAAPSSSERQAAYREMLKERRNRRV
jgi:hypothetical protein